MAFRVGGLSSGLDTNTMVQQLMQIESQPLVSMKTKQYMVELKKSLLSEVNSSLLSLQGKMENLLKDSTFHPLLAKSSNEDVATITIDDDSLMGNYFLDVKRLATSTTATSLSALNATANTAATVSTTTTVTSGGGLDTSKTFSTAGFDNAITDGEITINGVSFTIDADSTTVEEFMNQVNGDSEAGVLISYDSGTDKFAITTKDTGSDAKITLSDGTGFFTEADIDASQTYQGEGTVDLDATLEILAQHTDNRDIDNLNASGIYKFKINNYTFSFDAATTKLKDVFNEINESDAGVTVFYDPESDKISFSNRETGNTSIQFEDLQGNFLDAVGVMAPGAETLGVDASFDLNGVPMTRTTNNFEINGIKYDLKSVGTTSIDVEKDTDAIYNSIKEFVDQYNATLNLLNTRLSEKKDPTATTESMMRKGLLRADSTVSGIRSSLREITSETVSGLSNKFKSLMEIGISTSSDDFGKSGLLEIDETKLKDAIKNDPDAVQKLFFADSDADDKVDDGELGVAAKLFNKIDSYVNDKTVSYNGRTYKSGIIQMRLDSMSKEIERYDDDIENFEERLEQIEERYWRQFTALETALSKLNNQSSWLAGQIASLPTSNG